MIYPPSPLPKSINTKRNAAESHMCTCAEGREWAGGQTGGAVWCWWSWPPADRPPDSCPPPPAGWSPPPCAAPRPPSWGRWAGGARGWAGTVACSVFAKENVVSWEARTWNTRIPQIHPNSKLLTKALLIRSKYYSYKNLAWPAGIYMKNVTGTEFKGRKTLETC